MVLFCEEYVLVNVNIVFQLNYKCIYIISFFVVLGIEPRALCIIRQAFFSANVCR